MTMSVSGYTDRLVYVATYVNSLPSMYFTYMRKSQEVSSKREVITIACNMTMAGDFWYAPESRTTYSVVRLSPPRKIEGLNSLVTTITLSHSLVSQWFAHNVQR